MRCEPNRRLDQFRVSSPPSPHGKNWGMFVVPTGSVILRIISSGTDTLGGWEHVSVSTAERIPTWEEMQLVKDLFWDAEETVVQFHPKRSAYKNVHPFCLHLWRPLRYELHLPPTEMV